MKQLIFVLYVAVLIVMGAATFVEAAEGTSFVHQHFYGTWWFSVLWALLAIAGTIYIIRCKERRYSILLLHASFLIILSGALLTHLTGRSGTIHLRMNEPQDIAVMEHNGKTYLHRLDFEVELTDFQIIEDEGGNVKDYRSEFNIITKTNSKSPSPLREKTDMSVSMNNIAKYGNIRLYQMSYDYDGFGSTLMINRDPYGLPVTYCGYALLFISFIWIVTRGHKHSPHIMLTTLILTAAWCLYYFVLDGSWSQIPVLRHPLLIFHVVIIILAYALLLIQTIISAWALIKKKERVITVTLPALCLLSIGIFLGAIWANISWGNYWSWDSKETWALITLMIYAVPVHRRSLPIFNSPRIFNVYMLLAFLTVLMTYFGVNYLLPGMHSYA